MLTDELVQQYEQLWENGAPMEQIADFCRHHLQKINHQDKEENELLCILRQSYKWGPMTCMPVFLKHLKDDDDELLMVLGEFFKIFGGGNNYLWRCMTAARILSMKTVLPDKVRAFFWRLMMKTISWPYRGLIYESCADITLVDNETIRKSLVYHKKSGYERVPPGFYFMDAPLRIQKSLSRKMQEAIRHDSISMFEMERTLSGKKISASMLRLMFCYRRYNLVEHLMRKHSKALASILSPLDMLICFCRLQTDPQLVNILEELHPGICKCVDKLGNTPLWYCLVAIARVSGGRFHTEEFEQTLIHYGCNPDQRNHLGLSYRICKEMLEKVEKIR